jgi:hypothetical protein
MILLKNEIKDIPSNDEIIDRLRHHHSKVALWLPTTRKKEVYLSEKVVVGSEFEFIWAYQMVVDTPKMLNCLKACYNLHTFLVV